MTSAREFIKGIAKETPAFEVNCVGIATTKKANMGSTKAIGVDVFPYSGQLCPPEERSRIRGRYLKFKFASGTAKLGYGNNC